MVTETVKEWPLLTVPYDGACPMFRHKIGIYRALQPTTPVCLSDASEAALPLPLGTTREQRLERFHVRSRRGQLLSGAEPFLALWADAAALGVPPRAAWHGPVRRAALIVPTSTLEQTP